MDGQTLQSGLTDLFTLALRDLGVTNVVPDVTIASDAAHGDYVTNIAMRLARELKKSPMDIALQVKNILEEKKKAFSHNDPNHTSTQKDQNTPKENTYREVLQVIDTIEVAAPGFINITIAEANLSTNLSRVIKEGERFGTSQTLQVLNLKGEADGSAKHIMVEFAHPNTHKAFHIGHLRNITTGESLIRLLEATGHSVTRANYQGDVGMHIAKCLWAMLKLPEFDPASVRDKEIHAKVEFLGKAYAAGSTRFEADDAVKAEIGVINKQIYAKDPAIYDIYKETRQWSLDYFAGIYARVGSHYDRLYFESETYEAGKKTVLEGVSKGIFEESDGAVIFPGEKYGLHTRVFITKEGNATYEGKDMGLAPLQHKEYHPDLIMHVLGPEQYSYTRVIFKALDLLFPETAHRQFHKTYGWVKLKHGKMSSRTGQVVLGEWLLDEAKTSIYEILKQSKSNYSKEDQENIAEHCAIAAVKYAFLRVSTDQEIAFDIKESVSFDGDSGPYLMYSYARCKSVLRKAEEKSLVSGITADSAMNAEEKSLARALFFFPEIVADAARELSPNILCKYLFELAQAYNLFYQKNPILTAEASSLTLRLMLTTAVSQVLQNGLSLLGIATVERM